MLQNIQKVFTSTFFLVKKALVTNLWTILDLKSMFSSNFKWNLPEDEQQAESPTGKINPLQKDISNKNVYFILNYSFFCSNTNILSIRKKES